MFTQYAFAQFSGCGPNEVRDITGECVSAFGAIVAWDKSTYKICDTGIIIIEAPEENTNPNLIQTFFIHVSSDSSSFGKEVFMVETGNDTGIFVGDLQLCLPGLYVLEGDKIYATYDDITAEASIGSITITPTSVSTDKSHYEKGDTIIISGTVSNYQSYPVSISILDPVGEYASVHQLTPTYDGEYSVRVGIGSTFQYDGTYTVIVGHASFSSSQETTFTFGDVRRTLPEKTEGSTRIQNTSLEIDYKIVGGKILDVEANHFKNSLIFNIDSAHDGELSFDLPFSIAYIKSSYSGINYKGEADGKSTQGSYVGSVGNDQTLSLNFPAGVRTLEFFFDDWWYDSYVQNPISPSVLQVMIAPGSSSPVCAETKECFLPRAAYIDVGDTITWINKDSAFYGHTLATGTAADGPDGIFMSDTLKQGDTFSHTFTRSGEFYYFDIQHPWMDGYVIVRESESQPPTPPTPTPFDNVPPLILTPSDMTVDATDSSGTRVDYSVKAIDDEDGVLRPNCSPSSGSLFPIGDTTVTCSATDFSGNSDRKSFLITVNSPDVIIPSWIKDVAGFWCGDEIDNASFIEAIQYLINNDVIIVPTTVSSGSGVQEIPNWIKSNACWWSQGLITNSDFASGLQYLIGQGIIRV